jgi:hypothetical protein
MNYLETFTPQNKKFERNEGRENSLGKEQTNYEQLISASTAQFETL